MSEKNPFNHVKLGESTQDVTTCEICNRWCKRGLCQSIIIVYGSQAKIASEVCAKCMHRMGFRPQRVLDEDDYQRMADGLTLLRRMKENRE